MQHYLKKWVNRFFPAGKNESRQQAKAIGAKIDGLYEHISAIRIDLAQIQSQQESILHNSLEIQRQWQEAFIRGEVDNYRQWQEAFIRGEVDNYRHWEETMVHDSLEIQRQWQEAFVRGELEPHRLQSLQIQGMLEVLWQESGDRTVTLEQQGFLNQAEHELDVSLDSLKRVHAEAKKPMVLFCGDNVKFDRGTCSFMRDIARQNPQYDYLHLSEVSWLSPERTGQICLIPFHIVPDILAKRYRMDRLDIPLSDEDLALLTGKASLREAVLKMCRQNPYITENFAKYVIVAAYRYYSKAFQILQPHSIFLWNVFYHFHHVILFVARELQIPVICMEFGPIPGTFVADQRGLLGESMPCEDYETFRRLPVNEEELARTDEIIDYLLSSGMNRYTQIETPEMNALQETLKASGRPVLLFIDQPDTECGAYPPTEYSRDHYMPCFESSIDGVLFLAGLAEKNGWELVYKLHPIRSEMPCGLPENIHVIRQGDINKLVDFADVTISMLSSVSYTAALRGRPVVLTGYNELRGKGCVYEAYCQDAVENMIQTALNNGMTVDMKRNMKLHVAQMLKYYLYDDNRPRALRYGRATGDMEL